MVRGKHVDGIAKMLHLVFVIILMVSTVGCDSRVVNVYDSLYSALSENTIYLIASLISSTSSKLEFRLIASQVVKIVVF